MDTDSVSIPGLAAATRRPPLTTTPPGRAPVDPEEQARKDEKKAREKEARKNDPKVKAEGWLKNLSKDIAECKKWAAKAEALSVGPMPKDCANGEAIGVRRMVGFSTCEGLRFGMRRRGPARCLWAPTCRVFEL
eukprot:4055726-Alexandrium_andersonii.AAC.1